MPDYERDNIRRIGRPSIARFSGKVATEARKRRETVQFQEAGEPDAGSGGASARRRRSSHIEEIVESHKEMELADGGPATEEAVLKRRKGNKVGVL